MQMIKFLLTVLVVMLLTSCSTSLSDYEGTTPQFKLERFFNGELKAWGTFQDINGEVVRRFYVEMIGTWDGKTGILDEDFFYADGEKQKRIWTLTHEGGNKYSGTAPDVVGKAFGEVNGFAFNWQYTMSLPVDDEVYEVHFDDWMYLVDEKNVINRAEVSKFGVTVGEVIIHIQKM
ncbi:DUF3833 domain-containing protein [Pleionea sediminis]|uniref:DUF3833 domain-containing protein n=1 Tax=Pleionea sediminis TaxID=2569479 RepID=UPI00118663C9|nr:DUF3833 domain-containing protein [Pleionea sediminis]